MNSVCHLSFLSHFIFCKVKWQHFKGELEVLHVSCRKFSQLVLTVNFFWKYFNNWPSYHLQCNVLLFGPPCTVHWSADLPRSAVWHVCLAERLSWLWSQCQLYWRMPTWMSYQRSGTGMTSCQRYCCQWSITWTCSRSSGRQHLDDTCHHSSPGMTWSASFVSIYLDTFSLQKYNNVHVGKQYNCSTGWQ